VIENGEMENICEKWMTLPMAANGLLFLEIFPQIACFEPVF
jgi:hypothetical protein